jgi:cbb3-type cytochrome oxidase cytochrome c subunit/cytochrome c551/c552
LRKLIWPSILLCTVAFVVRLYGNQASAPDIFDAEILLAQSQCFACHAAGPDLVEHIQPTAAPDLSLIGTSHSPGWLKEFLLDPQSLRPETSMPALLRAGATDDSGRAAVDVAEDLVAYLVNQSGGFAFEPIEVQAEDLELGAKLFDQIGCLPCHPKRLAGRRLNEQSSVNQLRDFLLDPAARRPGTMMPKLSLSSKEATAISAWLLQGQGDVEEQYLPGLEYFYFEQDNWPSSGPVNWSEMEALDQGTALSIHDRYGRRRERFGLLFSGYLKVTEGGEYQFLTGSDDGSEIYLDGRRLVNNLGHHGNVKVVSDPVVLGPGLHEIRITFFEQSGDEILRAGWSGPDFGQREFTAEELFHKGVVPHPGDSLQLSTNAEQIQRGAEHFQTLGCGACHFNSVKPSTSAIEPKLTKPAARPAPAPAWSELRAEARGCLARKVPAGLPNYRLDRQQRNQLVNLLATRTSQLSPNPQLSVRRSMRLQQCDGCHSRDGVGGPGELQAYFLGADDLGEEGRIPPDLSGVGSKLRPDWMHRVIADGLKFRPSMHTRMPGFGFAVAEKLATQFLAHDGNLSGVQPSNATHPKEQLAFDPEMAAAGRQLTGVAGMSCIACHSVASYPSIGVQGPDLASMYERLQPEWFQRWLLDPPKIRPGTRMPAFFPNGHSTIQNVFDGDPQKQIDALWQYLSLGHSMPLPKGLVVERSEYALVPMDRVIYFGTFMQGLSARVLAVGFPERVNAAFDADHVRLAQLWQGDFLNAQGTWQGRAGQLEVAAGTAVFDLPDGPAFALLESTEADWPAPTEGERSWRMQGHRRNGDGHPTFVYRLEPEDGPFANATITVEESLHPSVQPGEIGVQRKFLIHSNQKVTGLNLRAARQPTLEPQPGGQGGARSGAIQWHSPDTQIRNSLGQMELLVPVEFHPVGDHFEARIEVQMSW